MFTEYLNDRDWQINENANTQKSINGLNNYVREQFTKNYWLHEIYPEDVRNAHQQGDIHIHDLGFFGAYCVGWDLRLLLMKGFGGVPWKSRILTTQTFPFFLGANCQLHLHDPRRNGRSTGLVIV